MALKLASHLEKNLTFSVFVILLLTLESSAVCYFSEGSAGFGEVLCNHFKALRHCDECEDESHFNSNGEGNCGTL